MPSRAPHPQTIDRIKVILRRDLKLGPDVHIPDDMAFFGGEFDLDSLDVLLLLTSIEKEFGIKIPNEAVGKAVFANVTTLAEYLDGQTETAVPSSARQTDPLELLPHRDPFRFVSRVLEIKPNESGQAIWSVSGAEPFFIGHFPGRPIVPGVLIAEALAQLSGLVGLSAAGQNQTAGVEGKLAQVDVRFDQSVSPPAEILLRSRLTRAMGPLRMFDVSASVGAALVARGTLTLARSSTASEDKS